MPKLRFTILILFVIICSDFSFAQVQSQDKYTGYLYELLFYRQPSARAEAMGRGIFANNENEFSSFYNPAQTSIGKGVDLNFSHSTRFLTEDNINYNYIGASYNLNKIGAFGLSSYHLKYVPVTDETGRETGDNISYTLYTLNYSREIVKDFYAGINLNILHTYFPFPPEYNIKANDIFPVDLGLYKKFTFLSPVSPNITHSVQLAASLFNLAGAKATFENLEVGGGSVMPITLRLGASYNMELMKDRKSKLLNVFAHIGYENVLNSDTSSSNGFNSVKFGGEITIIDIFSLRAGYNTRNIKTDYSEIKNQFTYGAGVKIPLDKILNLKAPLSLSIDYVNMKQPFPDTIFGDVGSFNTYALRLNYIPSL